MRMERILKGKREITVLFSTICVLIVVFFIKAYIDGKFSSAETLRAYIAGFGILGPLVLTALQAVQVVVPVLPGFLGCAVGAVLFGCMGGFWCNYIGISAGSIAAFLIAKNYGSGLIRAMFASERYQKWMAWAGNSRSYSLILFLMILLPLCPDDFFCYFSGVTDMSVKKFIWIIILAKPWCILAYSFLFSFGLKMI